MYVCWWLSVSPDTEETDFQMKQSDYNNDPFSNLLLQVSIECDHQINRFEHLDVLKWRKNNKKSIIRLT